MSYGKRGVKRRDRPGITRREGDSMSYETYNGIKVYYGKRFYCIRMRSGCHILSWDKARLLRLIVAKNLRAGDMEP